MFYLSPRSRIIVSIWETSELKRENIRRKKREKEEEEAKVESLRYKRFIVYSLKTFAEIFCYFFLFLYFIDSCERGLFNRALFSTFLISLLFLFFFFLFFFWSRQQVSPFGTCNGSNLSYRTLLFFFDCKETRGAPGRFVFFSVTWSGFVSSWNFAFIFFSNYSACAKVIRLCGLRACTSEKCVLLRTFVPV